MDKDHGIQSHHFMANRRRKSRSSDIFYFPGLPNYCRWCLQPCIKRHLLLGRKAMTNLDSIFKSRNITLPTKVYIVKTVVVMPHSSVHGDSPGKNTGVGCHALLQGIFPIQGSNPGLLHCRQILYQLKALPYTFSFPNTSRAGC